jgi:hypothetical protein
MSRRDYKLWRFWLDDGSSFSADVKGGVSVGTRVKGLDGEDYHVWYVEEGRGVRNARLESATQPHNGEQGS